MADGESFFVFQPGKQSPMEGIAGADGTTTGRLRAEALTLRRSPSFRRNRARVVFPWGNRRKNRFVMFKYGGPWALNAIPVWIPAVLWPL
jgi:hypothetical protein